LRKILQHRLALGTMIGLVIVGALNACRPSNSEPVAAPTTAEVAVPTDPASIDAAPALGPAAAPVTIVEYADFGCPACWEWHKLGILDQLRAKYGDQIRFVWRDFPVITLLSPKAAEAGQCAHEQNKFWEFHDVIYQHEGSIQASDLQAYAAEIGLNVEQFTECVTSRRYRDRVNAQQHEAFERGLKGAPAFFVNGKPIIGPQSLAVFEKLIDPILAAKKQ
jgi:protein-disulfide isomerase